MAFEGRQSTRRKHGAASTRSKRGGSSTHLLEVGKVVRAQLVNDAGQQILQLCEASGSRGSGSQPAVTRRITIMAPFQRGRMANGWPFAGYVIARVDGERKAPPPPSHLIRCQRLRRCEQRRLSALTVAGALRSNCDVTAAAASEERDRFVSEYARTLSLGVPAHDVRVRGDRRLDCGQ